MQTASYRHTALNVCKSNWIIKRDGKLGEMQNAINENSSKIGKKHTPSYQQTAQYC